MHACFRGRRGFSLIEVLIATVILSVGIVTSMFTSIIGTRAIVNAVYGQRQIGKLAI